MKKLSKTEMKNVKGGNVPVPAGCKCIGEDDLLPPGFVTTGQGYPKYCTAAKPVLICPPGTF